MAMASGSLALALLFASLLAGSVFGDVDGVPMPMLERFRAWQATYNRTYATPEESQHRLQVYMENVRFIDATNQLSGSSYELGENQFADLTNDEFRDMYLMKIGEAVAPAPEDMGEGEGELGTVNADGGAPNRVDWRAKGAVTPVKNQQNCGSCWAFATVASIEGVHKISTGRLMSMSEQEIVDCDRGGRNQGCNGGWPSAAMDWVARNRGITTESDYPYTGRQGQCRRDKTYHHAAKIRGGRAVPRNNEAALEQAVAGQPVTVLIDASSPAFRFYKRGVLSGPCGTNLNHAVTAVGYGAQPGGGRKYWIVKNSWGKSWGEGGYVRMERRVRASHGTCGIAMAPYYPVM